jgi:hypothetical protein
LKTIVAASCMLAACRATASVLYVDAAAPTGGQGQSWATALANLQAGLELAWTLHRTSRKSA